MNSKMQNIRIVVSGALGKMGREVIRTVANQDNFILAGAADAGGSGEDAGTVAGLPSLNVSVSKELELLLAKEKTKADVMVDFTAPDGVMNNIHTALKNKVSPVVGTTGITDTDLKKIGGWVKEYETGAIIAPNFAIGAILLMEFSRMAARFFPLVELIEMHHDQKIDAPSGTAIKTAQLISEAIRSKNSEEQNDDGIGCVSHNRIKGEIEKVPHARGGTIEGISVHSVRLPGMVARQDVIFGAPGQTLTISHNTIDRSSFMPGLIMAINYAPQNKDLIYGIENLIKTPSL